MAADQNEQRAVEQRDASPSIDALWRQGMWFLAAAGAGGAALYFNWAEDRSEDFQRIVAGVSPWLPAGIVTLAMVLICRLRDLAFPGTGGTGIPQAIAALKMGERAERSRLLSLRVAAGKALLLTLGMFGGATVGREGPSVHVAACLLYLTTRVAKYPRHLVERGLILAGGAAGIASAFNAPAAGIIFAFEEIGRSFEKDNAGTIVRTVIVACVLCWIPLSNYTFYGEVNGAGIGGPLNWGIVIAVGFAGGLLGGAFARGVLLASAVVRRVSKRRPYATAGAIGLGLATLGLLSGGQSYGGGYPQAHAILIEGRVFPWWYAFAKCGGSFLSLVSAIPGGLFDPSLSVGAGLGQVTWPLASQMDRTTYIMMMMAAYFAGVVQSPITAAVIVAEMTAAGHLVVPLLTATITAYGASRLVCPISLYEALAEAFIGRSTPTDPA